MVDIINAARQADGVESSETLESMTTYYSHLSNTDLHRDRSSQRSMAQRWGMARSPGGSRTTDHRSTSRCATSSRSGETAGSAPSCWPATRPAWSRSPPSTTRAPKCSSPPCAETDPGGEALLLQNGYEPFTYDAVMVRPTPGGHPDAPVPDGLEIRPVSEDQVRAIWEADQEANKDHVGASPPTAEDYERFLAFPTGTSPCGRWPGMATRSPDR